MGRIERTRTRNRRRNLPVGGPFMLGGRGTRQRWAEGYPKLGVEFEPEAEREMIGTIRSLLASSDFGCSAGGV